MPDRFERFSFAMLEIYRHWHDIATEEMRRFGLKVPHALYLLTMQHYEEGITATQLAELCGRDKSEISRCMAILEKRGLVVRDQTSYRALLRLTEDGKAAAAALRERAQLAVSLGGRGISEKNRTSFYETLELIAYNLQTISQAGLPSDKPSPAEPGRTEDLNES